MHGKVRLVDIDVLLICSTGVAHLVEKVGMVRRVWVSVHEVELYEVDGSVDARRREMTCLRLYAERKGLI